MEALFSSISSRFSLIHRCYPFSMAIRSSLSSFRSPFQYNAEPFTMALVWIMFSVRKEEAEENQTQQQNRNRCKLEWEYTRKICGQQEFVFLFSASLEWSPNDSSSLFASCSWGICIFVFFFTLVSFCLFFPLCLFASYFGSHTLQLHVPSFHRLIHNLFIYLFLKSTNTQRAFW